MQTAYQSWKENSNVQKRAANTVVCAAARSVSMLAASPCDESRLLYREKHAPERQGISFNRRDLSHLPKREADSGRGNRERPASFQADSP
jgi:hypothetical protein